MVDKKYKKLFSNTILFTVANLGSKLIQFLLVPLYTYTLTKAQYGIVDLVITTINMLLPLFALSIADAVFRFTMDKGFEKYKVLANGIFVTGIGSLLILLISPILHVFKIPSPIVFSGILILGLFFNLIQNYARADGFEKQFAISGVVNGLTLSALNVYFLAKLHIGVSGYMYSLLLSYAISVVYLVISIKLWRKLDFSLVSIKEIKKYLHYSVPLIPNAFSWWFTNDANRFFILFFVGVSGNGLYAVANKIPSLLNMVYGIFSQAWQVSAVEEFDKEENNEFYENVLNMSIKLLLFVSCCLLSVVKPGIEMVVEKSYYDAWKFIAFLLLAAIFSNMSAFLGTIFLAAKKTRSILSTTIVGMVTNLIFNLCLIPYME